ncbi:hypothetical protein ACHAXR_013296 [Thalassiosira sp. AJA248-18]
MSIAASRLQQRRRDQERVFHETQSFLDQHHNTQRLQDWEHRTQKHIEKREVNAITQKLLQQDEEELNQRKNELQSLYNDEMSQWKTTLKSSLEVTPEQRMEQIRTRAYELKAKREAERQEFVEECYERQWRDACDDLRAIESKSTLDRIVTDRERMIKIKRMNEEHQPPLQKETSAMSLINKDESHDHIQRRQSNLDFTRALEHQVQWKRSQVESMTMQKQHEEQAQLRHLAMLEKRAMESAKASVAQKYSCGQETLKETRLRATYAEERQRIEKSQNLLLLQHALDREQQQQQILAEKVKQEMGKGAASEYVQCLREEAKIEEKERENVNRIRDEELKHIAAQNDDKMHSEIEARRRWQEEVDITRQEQIRRKQVEAEALRQEVKKEAEEIQIALRRAEEADKRDAEKAQALQKETMLANKATIETREKESERQQQEKYLIQKQIQNDKMVYRKRLDSLRL